MSVIKKILLAIIFIFIFFSTSCIKKEVIYLENPIAIVYEKKTPYIININQEKFSLAEYDEVLDDFNDFLIVKKDGKYGIIQNTGKPSSEIIFDHLEPVRENKAVARIGEQYVIVNTFGEILYTLSEGLTSESYFSQNHLVIHQENHYGYLIYNERNNTFTETELLYNYAGIYKDDFAVVAVLESYNIYETDAEGNETSVVKETVYLDNLKYNYVGIDEKLLFSTFEFDFADDFYNDWARVGVYKECNYYVYKQQKPKKFNTLVYSYVGINGSYLNYYHYSSFFTTVNNGGSGSVEEIKVRMNQKIEVPYARNFNDGYAVIGNYYTYTANSNEFYKSFMIIDEFGSMDYVDAIFSKTSYYCGYECAVGNIVQVESYQPNSMHNYFVEAAKVDDTLILRSAQTFSSTIWSYYFNYQQDYYENNVLKTISSFDKITINPYIQDENGNDTIPEWLELYVNEYYPESIEGTGLKISISEIASPYEADHIHKSPYIGDVQISRMRLIKKDTTGVIGFRTYKKYNKVSDSDLTYVEAYFIIDPIYDKIVY